MLELIEKMIEYIEYSEMHIDMGDFGGDDRNLKQLIIDDEMPDLYWELLYKREELKDLI